MKRYAVSLVLLALMLALVPEALVASVLRAGNDVDGQEHVAFGQTITIEEGQAAENVVCMFCTVLVHGDVKGNMVSLFSRVEVGDGRTIHENAVVIGGDLVLGNESNVEGNLVLFGGDLQQAASATIHGNHVLFSGGGWLLVLLLPLVLPILVIWLVVRVVFRRRYRFPAYPGGRGF